MEEINNKINGKASTYDTSAANQKEKELEIQINIKKPRKQEKRVKPNIKIPVFEINRQYYERIEKEQKQKMLNVAESKIDTQNKQVINLDINYIKDKNNEFYLDESEKMEKDKNIVTMTPEISEKEMSIISTFSENEDDFSYRDIKDNLKFLDDKSSMSSEQMYDSLNSSTIQQNSLINKNFDIDYYNQLKMLHKMQFLNPVLSNNINNNINLDFNQNLNTVNLINNNLNYNYLQKLNNQNMINYFNLLNNNQKNNLRNISSNISGLDNIYKPVNLSFTQSTRMNDGSEGIIKVKYSSKLEKCKK